MCIIILLLFYYNIFIENFKRRQVILFVICGYFLLSVLTAIMHIRHVGFTFEGFIEEWLNCITSDVILNALEELGLTIFVLAHEISIYNAGGYIHEPFNILIHEFLVGIPGITNILPVVTVEGYDTLGLRALGGSFIADFYFYLGYGGFIFAIFWGYFLGVIDRLLKKLSCQSDYYKAGIFFPYCLLILSEVRSPFRIGYKVLILSWIFITITRFFISRIRLKL